MDATNLNLRHLRAFHEVGTCGRLSLAAEKINFSQPAITQAIAKLETVIGYQLFIRRPTGMFLTAEGELFYIRTGRALALLKDGSDHVVQSRKAKAVGRDRAFYRQITSTHLRSLIAIGRHKSFSHAARETGTSQPSLHRAARELEQMSAVEFYIKTPQGITLGKPAAELARFAQLAFSELRQGLDEIIALHGTDTSILTFGTLPLARSFILPKAINRITIERPNLTIKVIDGPYPDQLNALRHGEIDFLLGALREPAPFSDVREETLFEDNLAVIARTGHPLSERTDVSYSDLLQFPWVVPRPGTPTRHHFDKVLSGSESAQETQIIESSSLVLIRGLLLGSNRLTLLSRQQVLTELEQNQLCILPLKLRDTERAIGFTMRRNWQPTGTQKLLMDLIREVSSTPVR